MDDQNPSGEIINFCSIFKDSFFMDDKLSMKTVGLCDNENLPTATQLSITMIMTMPYIHEIY